ncbi:MAG: metallothionein [Cyanobacteria bacterium J083]|nr:MAG: metallothionein [Cyanobacteria bacterium J083]
MTNTNLMKCACEQCLCIVSLDAQDVIEKNGQYYCCVACANGHQTQTGCNHKGCNC